MRCIKWQEKVFQNLTTRKVSNPRWPQMTLEEGNCYDKLVYTYCLNVNVSAGTDVGRDSLKQPAI